MLIALLLLAPAGTTTNPPVTISFSGRRRFLYGDKAKVYLQTARDGYVVVLRSDARRSMAVVFDPVDTSIRRQIRGEGRGGEAFVVEDTWGGVLAAWSQTPFEALRAEHAWI